MKNITIKKVSAYAVWIVPFGFMIGAVNLAVQGRNFSSCSDKAFDLYNHQEYAKAIPYLKNILVMKPDTQGVQSMIGYSFLKEQHYKEAVQSYRQAIDDNTKRVEPLLYDGAEDHYFLGAALLGAGNKAAARLEWRMTIKMTTDRRVVGEARAGMASTS